MPLQLGQNDLSDLWSFIEGQLPSPRAEQVAALVKSDGAWRQAYERMTALDNALDLHEPAPAPADLAARVVSHVRRAASANTPVDWDDLSAYFDNELAPDRAAEIRRLLQTDALWKEAYLELADVQNAMDSVEAPAAPQGLDARIVQHARRAGRVSPLAWVLRIAAPLAAAAAIVLAVLAFWSHGNAPQPGTPGNTGGMVAKNPPHESETDKIINQALKNIPEQDRFAVENLDFFKDYDVLSDFDTLQALDDIDQG